MKFFTNLLIVVLLLGFTVQNAHAAPGKLKNNAVGMELPNELRTDALANLTVDDFLAMTPKKYKELTGQKMGIKNAIKLKAAQKKIKKSMKNPAASDIPQGLFVVLAIFGLAWIGMGVMDDWSGNNWWVNLILVLLCWLPGLIHALVKMKDYY